MSHRAAPASPAIIDAALADHIAEAMQALVGASRVRILGRLREGPSSVSQLAQSAGLTPSATSHQLRLLRYLGWVTRERNGRELVYALHDAHVGALLEEAINHVEHLRIAADSEAREAPAE